MLSIWVGFGNNVGGRAASPYLIYFKARGRKRTRLTVAFCLAPHVLFQLPLVVWPIACEGDTHTPIDARGKVIGLPRQRRFLPGLITPQHDMSAHLRAAQLTVSLTSHSLEHLCGSKMPAQAPVMSKRIGDYQYERYDLSGGDS
ncbi:unnamed protein product [Taenia asiatica]|uniref:Nitrate reductase n=1 Tax=Taenia asiatica TaxID=60517 RepID=A0A158R7F7_TAEAS|nr:unnamed protein product [Taenia asiatica]